MTEGSPPVAVAARARPVPITVICVIGFIGGLVSLALVFSSSAASVAPWYPPALAASALVGLACMVGLWQMRRWAVYAYTAMAVVTQLAFMMAGLVNPISLIIPTAVVVIMFIYLPMMR